MDNMSSVVIDRCGIRSEKRLLLVSSAEQLRDEVANKDIATFNRHMSVGMMYAFPKLDMGFDPDTGDLDSHKFKRAMQYMRVRMKSCSHPLAKEYVYGQAFKNTSVCQRSFIDAESGPYIKIGWSEKPSTRLVTLKQDAWRKFSAVHAGTVLVLPVSRANMAEYVESCIFGTLPEDHHLSGEWYLDTFSVWKMLVMWFSMAYYLWAKDTGMPIDRIDVPQRFCFFRQRAMEQGNE